MKKFFHFLRNMIITILAIILAGLLIIIGLNIYVKLNVRKNILTVEETKNISGVDCIMVLGASVRNGDTPSAMLKDRLDKGIEVFNAGASSVMLMSGDRTDRYYDEVSVMREYAITNGIPEENIAMDPEGYSTYESMYRAKEIYGVNKMIIVTQKYHLSRALYIAKQLGIEAYGVATEDITYKDQWKRDVREILAIDKDFIKVHFK